MRRFIFILLLLAMGICAFYMLEQINMTSYALAVSRLSSSYFIEVYRNGDSRSLNEAKYIIDEVGSIKSGFDGFLLFGKTTLVDDSALLQIVDTSFLGVAATRPNTALALLGRARPAGHPAARIAA